MKLYFNVKFAYISICMKNNLVLIIGEITLYVLVKSKRQWRGLVDHKLIEAPK